MKDYIAQKESEQKVFEKAQRKAPTITERNRLQGQIDLNNELLFLARTVETRLEDLAPFILNPLEAKKVDESKPEVKKVKPPK